MALPFLSAYFLIAVMKNLTAITRPWFNERLLMKTPVLLSLAFLLVFVLGDVRVYAEEVERPMILQFMVGEMVISNDDPRISNGDYNVTLFGVAAQKPFYGEMSQVGIETGALFN